MGQKINPISLRLGIIGSWRSRWWPKTSYKNQLEEDMFIRDIIKIKAKQAGIIKIDIERTADNAYKIFLKVARPGIVIGRGGQGVADLTKAVEKKLSGLFTQRKDRKQSFSVNITVEEMKRSEISSAYVAQSIAWDIEKRMPARRVLKRYIGLVMQNREAQGVKIKLSGRINGAEIARQESLSAGKLPLQTLRANIDYSEATSFNTYGTIGIKVWIYKGEVFGDDKI
ncbi:MAG: 30S ribosomal protein S3 [Candidatus Harrisonbacteria bacterium CG10_big_fil_rev_8_21_14_0_10_40_38]|uniref:Small ribosomal subunit protein uS3 n=1 Tax=Candidatus Harrisonbacteria bacterium CG10_big_fil_rev_8_21_14_0_10_40_38 TaxID=1974583 RepID=A0A2H0USH8_9BACT|nr:MAG: 30S ribosomal protein S3 [Candidatus Harrisonbacteria bacterium CG10_big_fil_rev_8_21_14_0_10_40_38]